MTTRQARSDQASARVAHANIWAEREAAATLARERADARREQFIAGQRERAERSRPKPTDSALALIQGSTREARARRAKELERAEEQARLDAIERATNPPPKDPRSTAARLAEGAGQSRLNLG